MRLPVVREGHLKAIQSAPRLDNRVVSTSNLVHYLHTRLHLILARTFQPQLKSFQLQMELVLRRKRLGNRDIHHAYWFSRDLDLLIRRRDRPGRAVYPKRARRVSDRWLRNQLGAERGDLHIRKTSCLVRSQIVGGPECIEAGGLQTAVVRNSLFNRLFESQFREVCLLSHGLFNRGLGGQKWEILASRQQRQHPQGEGKAGCSSASFHEAMVPPTRKRGE